MANWFIVIVYVVITALSGIIGSITGVGGVLTKIGMDLVGVNSAEWEIMRLLWTLKSATSRQLTELLSAKFQRRGHKREPPRPF